MRKLLSLPPCLVPSFHDVEGVDKTEYFCTSDPIGSRVGSGGGTAWLLMQAASDAQFRFHLGDDAQPTERSIIVHAGGQSRRLPAYAPSGKILTPMLPMHGDLYGPSLLSVQMPLLERIMDAAPMSLRTLIVSGDVLVTAADHLDPLPSADVVCYGLPASWERMSHHGVYAMPKSSPTQLDFMLQKPTPAELEARASTHDFLLDIGLWLLSERALRLLRQRSLDAEGNIRFYDLYSDFGGALGLHPAASDAELSTLSVAVLPLPEGRFLHFGSCADLIASSSILSGRSNPERLWVENSCVDGWHLSSDNIVTGVPENNWRLTLAPGQCVDVVPLRAGGYALRAYGFSDPFRGLLSDSTTSYLSQPLLQWVIGHGLSISDFGGDADIHQVPLFPVLDDMATASRLLPWILGQTADADLRALYLRLPHLSAQQISDGADVAALARQRQQLRRSKYDESRAFSGLRRHLATTVRQGGRLPDVTALEAEVSASSPLRIDVSGGWTDTPPFCLYHGGSVVNVAIDLDGMAPLSCTLRPIDEPLIRMRSIDLQTTEDVCSWQQLRDYAHLGEAFSISKAALSLAGFVPEFCTKSYGSLVEQLGGRGFEITTHSRVPAGSGLGTSSILAATVLEAVGRAFALAWSREDVCQLTLVLEQLLTAGGGWQDQYGGIYGGVKLLTTLPGSVQRPHIEQLPTTLWTHPDLAPCHLLYFTGITRMARQILAEIVRDMYLHDPGQRRLLTRMKDEAQQLAATIREAATSADVSKTYAEYGRLLRTNWQRNQQLDAGCQPPAIARLTALIDDLCEGYKLPGAGGGGFLYIAAKDEEAACRIRLIINENALSPTARFFDMTIHH